jgi:hypothetical protein
MPGHLKRAAATTFLSVTFVVGLPVAGHACHEGSFEQRINAASTLVADGSPVSALDCYQSLYTETDQFQSILLEERFYWEYHDALLKAASADPKRRSEYLQTATDVSDSYIDWYAKLNEDDRAVLQSKGMNRISNMLFDIGSTLEKLHYRDDILQYFEHMATHPEFFSQRSLLVWERTLLAFPDLGRERSYTEVRNQIAHDREIAAHWRAYWVFLQGLRKVRDMKRVAQDEIDKLRPILSTFA